MTITTEQLLAAGCIIDNAIAYDLTDIEWVAIEMRAGEWQLWKPSEWHKSKRRFRVKAITMRSEG